MDYFAAKLSSHTKVRSHLWAPVHHLLAATATDCYWQLLAGAGPAPADVLHCGCVPTGAALCWQRLPQMPRRWW
jgi:hypothetical protein